MIRNHYNNILLLSRGNLICEKNIYLLIIFNTHNSDALVKSHKSPFDKLRVNGGQYEIIDFITFVVSPSPHRSP